MTIEQKRNTINNGLMMGKIPPQAIDLEECVLGSIIDDSGFLMDVGDTLKPVHFYHEGHKRIFQAITNLSALNNPIDMMTVVAELRRTGELEMCGGAFYITQLTTKGLRVGSNIEYHSKLIIQKFMQREMIRISSDTIQAAYNDTADVFDIIEKNQNEVFLAVSDTHTKGGSSISGLVDKTLLELAKPPTDGLTGVGSGFKDLDAITGGWQPQDLIIIAARPAMGKTAFVLKCARNAAVKYQKPTVFFSLEMSEDSLTNRMLADETGIHLERILKRRVNEKEIEEMRPKLEALVKSPLIIDDTPALNVFEFRAKCRRLKKKNNIGLIVIDYLQLMHSGEKSGNRDNEIGIITRALKSVAKELNVPVIALSQLSRKVEERASKRPLMADLRESGNIEQDADFVGFLYRPEYYGITGANGHSTAGLCEFIVGKNRSGVCDTINLGFNGSFMRFKDWFDPSQKKKSTETSKVTNEETTGDLPF